jgi:hypothetical protein
MAEFLGGVAGVEPAAPRVNDEPPGQGGDWVSPPQAGAAVPSLDFMLDGPAAPGEPKLPAGYARIVRSVFKIDEEKVFAQATERLRFAKRAHLVEYGEIIDALDEASEIATHVSQLRVNAKAVLKSYKADVEVLRADMRAKAVAALQAEKPEKGGKTITDADVVARMAGAFPDEYRRQEELIAKVEGTVAFLDQLVEDWGARRRELEGMMRTSRRV